MADGKKEQLRENIEEIGRKLKEVVKTINEEEERFMKSLKDGKDVESYKHTQNLVQEKEKLEIQRTRLEKEIKIVELKRKVVKEYETRIRVLENQAEQNLEKSRKEKEDLEQIIDELEKKIDKLHREIRQLERELKEADDQMDSLERKIKENTRNHQKTMETMKDNHKKDIDGIKDCYGKRIHELNKKIEEYDKASKWDGEEMEKLRDENKIMKNDTKDNKKLIRYLEKDHHMLYIGQVCSDLQTNIYRYVIPEQHCAKDVYYKIKDVEKDINDKELLNEHERKEAEKKMKELKIRINWNHLMKLKRPIQLLQDQRNKVAHPQKLSKDRAIFAAQELEKQDKLKGKISKEVVLKIIEYWSIVESLRIMP